jgi:tetratricopeptide (TPR) repeat protein
MFPAGTKASRNDPCPCGSGRKFKHCCGALPGASQDTVPAAPPAAQTVEATQPEPDLGALGAMLRQRRLAEVETWASRLLKRDPDSGVLWKVLGVALAQQQGKEALPALRRAAELLPEDAEAQRNLGAVLKQQGRLEEALASFERVLAIEPHDLPVLIAAADCLCALGRARAAVPLYERALERNPRLLEAHNNLGNALQELGDCPRAVGCYRQALTLNPRDAEALANLGNALRQLGQLEEALSCAQRATALAPSASVAHNNLGLALAALARPQEAIASFRRAVELNPRFVQALQNLGNVLCDAGDYRAARDAYARAIELEPQRADTHCHLGQALYELGELAESIASYRRALALAPAQREAQLGLATALRLEGPASEAEAGCRAILDAEPGHVGALSLLGDLCADRGDFGQAEQLFQRALALDASSAAVLSSIAAHRRMTGADDAWLERAEQALAKPLPLAHEIGLRYALGKYYDDLGRYPEAFAAYARANELSKRHGSGYDRAGLERQVDEIMRTFDRAFLGEAHPGASDSELPVFVVGMPRSGTTLTEQILASHGQAFGAGEVNFWDHAAELFSNAGSGAEARRSALADLARDYLARLGKRSGGARRVIDKMPANFLHAGLIHVALPRARILHMQRHPLDTCLSLYFQNFGDRHPHARDLDSLAHYYGQYVRITDHWRAVLPASTLLEVPYEALVADQEHWTRRMLEFVGLPWDPRCLDFHRTERVVITASRAQVRQKINARSVGRWRNYEPYLAPLRPLLELVGGGDGNA